MNDVKRNLSLPLDLPNPNNKRLKCNAGIFADVSRAIVLESPDLNLLKLSKEELEAWIVAQPNCLLQTPTPSTAQILFPKSPYSEELEYTPDIVNNPVTESYPTENIVIKDEPQTVPSLGSTPPVSPINMESQEKIKLERKRLRNRVAAYKCRKRKLERIAKLEDKVKALKGENSELGQIVVRLKEEVYNLKQKVMKHATNGCQINVTTY